MEPNRPMLMIEGPKFSGFDFSPRSNLAATAGIAAKGIGAGVQSIWVPPEGTREPFIINGHRIVLPDKKDTCGVKKIEQGGGGNEDEEGLSHTASTAKSVWDCSIILSKYLEALAEQTPGFWTGKNVLELGAGQGIASFSAAALGAERVIITDVDSAVPALREGVQLNGFSAPQVQVMALDWTDRAEAMERIWNDLFEVPTSSSAGLETEVGERQARGEKQPQQTRRRRRLDYILASDVIWVDYLIPALVDTMGDLLQIPGNERRDSVMDEIDQHRQQQGQQHSSPSSPVVLLAYQFRSTRSDQLLFESLDRLGLSRQKLRLTGTADDSDGGEEEDAGAVYLDPEFRRSNLAIWKIWKD